MQHGYAAKLRDPRWQRRRLEVMQHAGFSCERCEAETEELHVHHRWYLSGREPWEYRNEQLACLCKTCHDLESAYAAVLKWCLSRAGTGDLARILGYVIGLNTMPPDMVALDSEEMAIGFADAHSFPVEMLIPHVGKGRVSASVLFSQAHTTPPQT